jgi:hypothetical protein
LGLRNQCILLGAETTRATTIDVVTWCGGDAFGLTDNINPNANRLTRQRHFELRQVPPSARDLKESANEIASAEFQYCRKSNPHHDNLLSGACSSQDWQPTLPAVARSMNFGNIMRNMRELTPHPYRFEAICFISLIIRRHAQFCRNRYAPYSAVRTVTYGEGGSNLIARMDDLSKAFIVD